MARGPAALGVAHVRGDGPAGSPVTRSGAARTCGRCVSTACGSWRRDAVRAACGYRRGSLAGHIVQRDADVVSVQLDDSLKARGVILCDLRTAARASTKTVAKRYLSDAVKPGEWKFVALNAALWSGGCFLYVPKGVEIELPVQLLDGRVGRRAGGLPAHDHRRGAQSKVTFIDETGLSPVARRGGRLDFVSGAVEIYDPATARRSRTTRSIAGARASYNFNTVRAILGRDAEFLAMATGIGSKMTKMRIDTEMPLPGARAQLLGVTFGNAEQHFDYNTLQNHVGHHTISDLQFKSALTDSASLVWYGITRINPTAGGSEANQTSRNMLLSEHAKAAPIPIRRSRRTTWRSAATARRRGRWTRTSCSTWRHAHSARRRRADAGRRLLRERRRSHSERAVAVAHHDGGAGEGRRRLRHADVYDDVLAAP